MSLTCIRSTASGFKPNQGVGTASGFKSKPDAATSSVNSLPDTSKLFLQNTPLRTF